MRRIVLVLALLLAAAGVRGAEAQGAEGAIEVSLVIVEPLAARVDEGAMTMREERGGVRLSAPVRVTGGGAPTVSLQRRGGAERCEAGGPGAAGEPLRLRCFIPGAERRADGTAPVTVTLLLTPGL